MSRLGISHQTCIFLSRNTNAAILFNIHSYRLCEMPHGCIFAQFLHKDSVKRVSAYQTWVFLYPAFQFSIDLGRVTLKHQEKHRSTKKSSIPFLHQKASLGPGWFHSQAHLVLWPEPYWNRGGAKYQIAFGSKLSGLVPTCHPSYHLPLFLFVMQSLNQQQCLLWFLSSRRSLQNHWRSQFLFSLT